MTINTEVHDDDITEAILDAGADSETNGEARITTHYLKTHLAAHGLVIVPMAAPSDIAVSMEREACAKIAEAIDSGRGNEKQIAVLIRARGNPIQSSDGGVEGHAETTSRSKWDGGSAQVKTASAVSVPAKAGRVRDDDGASPSAEQSVPKVRSQVVNQTIAGIKPGPSDTSLRLREALEAIIQMDDDAKDAYGKPYANLNGYGLVDLFDCVNHPFGSGEHKQQPYRSNNLEAALADARKLLAEFSAQPERESSEGVGR